MDANTYHTDHWRTIEDERIERYERMFVWREGHAELLAQLELAPGGRVMDYGCGPGFVSIGMAEMVAPGGQVHGVDINARFVADATARAANTKNVSFHLLQEGRIPLADAAVDRALCKNVLEYVPDLAATLAEFRRVIEPGGRLLAIDSDWGFVIVEPWGRATTERFFSAAGPAFKEPEIGRSLRGHLLDAGFEGVQVTVRAGVDTEGGSLLVLRNMASYATEFDLMSKDETESLLGQAEAAVSSGRFLFCLPQFVITATRP